MKISFVIPCYRSENTLESVVMEIIETISRTDYLYEIILVNDCSPDNVLKLIYRLCRENKNIIGINLAKNFGQHNALMAGYSYSNGDIVISVDDDGQIPVNESLLLIDKINQGFDVVYGTYDLKMHSKFRNFGSKVNDFMSEILIGKPKSIKITSFFAAKKFIIDECLKYNAPYPYILGLILRTTSSIGNVPVHHRSRQFGKSGYTFSKLISLWMNGFTAFSVKPLRISSILGFIVAVMGFVMGIWTIINKILNPSIAAGYSSINASILFIGGIILIMLGLIGEYLGRLYISANKSPQYVIKEMINFNTSEKHKENTEVTK